MKRQLCTLLVSSLAAIGTLSVSTKAEAQEIQITGPLAGQPSVRKLRQYRAGRFEVAPSASFTFLDEYRRTILFGGRLQYNLKEWIGFGVWGGYGLSTTTDLTDQIDSVAPRNTRTAVNVNHTGSGATTGTAPFADQVAKIQWMAAPQFTFTPFRGKLAIFQKFFLDTDLYLHGGLAFIGIQERGDCGGDKQTACTDPKSFALQSRTGIAPTFGLGFSFYITDLISLGLDYRAVPFSWNRGGFDSRGGGNNAKFPDQKIDSQDQTFKFNQMISIAVGFSLPSHPHISD